MKIRAIAGITFKEAKRDRILYLLFFFAALGIAASRVLAILTVGDRIKIIKDVGLASIGLFGVLMAILIGTGLVYKEIDKKTIYTLLAKPLHRSEFILGKFVGLVHDRKGRLISLSPRTETLEDIFVETVKQT